jgi:hypothetical protein
MSTAIPLLPFWAFVAFSRENYYLDSLDPQILGVTVQNFAGRAYWHREFLDNRFQEVQTDSSCVITNTATSFRRPVSKECVRKNNGYLLYPTTHRTQQQVANITFEVVQFTSIHPRYAINHLTPELNPSAQRCLTRFFTRDFAS